MYVQMKDKRHLLLEQQHEVTYFYSDKKLTT